MTIARLSQSPIRVTIHQPNLFPRHKVIQKLAAADIWIVLDDVQFAKREWQNRCMIVPDHGTRTPHWLTLPVRLPRGQASAINEVELIDATQALQVARNTVVSAYRHSPGWECAQRLVLPALQSNHVSLTQVCVRSTLALLACAGAAPTVYYASELALPPGDPSDRLAALTEMVGGSEYLCDSGGANYLQLDSFNRRDIAVKWQDWQEPSPAFADCTPSRNISALNLMVRGVDRYAALTRSSRWSDNRDVYALAS
jgi:WbqC-like protein family